MPRVMNSALCPNRHAQRIGLSSHKETSCPPWPGVLATTTGGSSHASAGSAGTRGRGGGADTARTLPLRHLEAASTRVRLSAKVVRATMPEALTNAVQGRGAISRNLATERTETLQAAQLQPLLHRTQACWEASIKAESGGGRARGREALRALSLRRRSASAFHSGGGNEER